MKTHQQSRPWDPATIANSTCANALVDQALEAQFQARSNRGAMSGSEARRNQGERAIKERRTVEALVLDTLAHHLSGVPEPLVIKLDKNWLSAGPNDLLARNRTVNDRLSDLEIANWIGVDRSAKINNRYVTFIWAGPELLTAVAHLNVTADDIGVEITSPEIELRGRKPRGLDSRRPVLAFEPTEQTLTIERKLTIINQHLQSAKLKANPYGSIRIDVRRRRVSRAFLDGSFARGGRLSGPAFWLSLRKDIRREALRIDGEPIAELDIQAAMPSIAYALEGTRPDGDPYTLDSPGDIPRDAVKLALMQMLWSHVKKGTPMAEAARSMIPGAYLAGQVFNFIRQRNQPIADRLGASDPCGAELMWHESEIIIDATLRCFAAGFSALPLHDALLVPCSQAAAAARLLSDAFEERLGVAPTIKSELFDGGAAGESFSA